MEKCYLLNGQDILVTSTNYDSSVAFLTQTVNVAASSTSLDSNDDDNGNFISVGQSLTFTATVSGNSGTPTGSVTFYDNNTVLSTVTLDASGAATYIYTATTNGGHDINAIYNGDSTYASSMGDDRVRVVPNGPVTYLDVSSSASVSQAGQTVTFTAMVTASNGATAPGTVSFYDGTTLLGTATLAQDTATFTTSALTPGVHNILAVYGGNGNLPGSVGMLSQTVNLAATTTSLTSSANPSPSGQDVTFTITVAAVDPNAGTPTGTVTFYDGTTFLGNATLSVVNGQVQATFTTAALTLGKHQILAIYSGDSTFADSGNALEQTISN